MPFLTQKYVLYIQRYLSWYLRFQVMLPNYLYNLHIFTELDFARLQLIYIRNQLVVYIQNIYAQYMPSIYLQYIGFGDYLYIINLLRKQDEHLQYILVFCLVYIKQNFIKRFLTYKVRYIIEQIQEAEIEQKLIARI